MTPNRVHSWVWFSVCIATFALISLVQAQTRPKIVQSVDLQIPWTPEPVRVGGREHLAYELHVTNLRPVDVSLTRVEVRDADRNSSLADLRDPQVIKAGMHGVVYLWVPVDSGKSMPARLIHNVELDLLRPTGAEHVSVQGGALTVRRTKPLVLDAPLRGGPWVALFDPKLLGGHRTSIYTVNGRARIPARFAVDYVRLERDGSHARGDDSLIANWHGYGSEVLAVADAMVVEAWDDVAEQPSRQGGEPLPLEKHSGNYVVLDLGSDRFAFYEHLRQGSVRVKAGDRVKRGQVIAQLGNTGSSSSGPHLHFHVADASADLAGEGVPYVFRSFEVVGQYPAIDTFSTGKPWSAAPSEIAGVRAKELPPPNSVIVFH